LSVFPHCGTTPNRLQELLAIGCILFLLRKKISAAFRTGENPCQYYVMALFGVEPQLAKDKPFSFYEK
jgi:hypothetical protein